MYFQFNLESFYICLVILLTRCVFCQECQSEIQLNSNDYINSVTVNGSQLNEDNVNDLLEFDDIDRTYCAPTNMRPFTMIISYSSPVLLTEIGIHGDDELWPASNDFVSRFSLLFSEDGDNFTDYNQGAKQMDFTVPCYERHYFVLCSPITASSMRITVHEWNDRPCMSLLMMGCNYSDAVVDHSLNITNSDSMTMILTTTESVTITQIQTTTESFTVYLTVTPSPSPTSKPSPTQSSDTAGSTSCSSSDTDNTPIYVTVIIVIVGLLITITVVVMGVLLCRRYWQRQKRPFSGPTNPLFVDNKAHSPMAMTESDLHGGEGLEGKQKLELDLSHGKPAMLTNVSVPAHNDQRLETVNLQYESFDGPQAIDTDDYVIAALDTDGNQFSSESSEAAVTSKNNPIIEDNPAYSTSSSGPPLTDNPAYSVI